MLRLGLIVVVSLLALILFGVPYKKNPSNAGIAEHTAAAATTALTPQRSHDTTPTLGTPNKSTVVPSSTQSARTILQQSAAIREVAFQSSQSNDPYLAIAAQDGLIYCVDIGGNANVPAEMHAAKSFWLNPNFNNLNVSSIKARTQAVLYTRDRCDAKNAEVVALDLQLRSALSEKLTAYNRLLAEMGRLPDLDFNALSLESRSLLLGGNGTALLGVIDQLSTKLFGPGATDSEMFAAILATQLAACQLGDICDQQSFRKHALCLRWGACAGTNVDEALRALLADRSDLQQSVDRGATRLRQSLQSVRM